MQKVLRRTKLAKSQAQRRSQILSEKVTIRDTKMQRRQNDVIRSEQIDAIRESRKIRRDDWEMGPLAPWRDSPAATGKYGSYSSRFAVPPDVPKKFRVECMFKVGDRVCVVEGREGVKGKIGKIKDLDRKTEIVRIRGVNMIKYKVIDALREPGQPEATTTDGPIPLASLRLVYPLPDPITGIPRDCILTNLVRRNSRFDVYENRQVFDRILMPQNIRIPWPEPEEKFPEDQACDTLRFDVEKKTFLPTLLRPPMPPSVLDELRGKYSIFRERHDEEWVAAKKAEDEEAAKLKTRGTGMLPRGARNVARGQGAGSAGSRFMESKRMRPREDDANLEAVGAWMAARGLGMGKGNAKEKGASGVVGDVPLVTTTPSMGQAENSAT